MNAVDWDQLNKLSTQRSNAKAANDGEKAFAIQRQILRLLVSKSGPAQHIASALNHLAVICLTLRHFTQAELYSRGSHDYFAEHGGTDHETFGTYFSVTARALACQERNAEAAEMMERSIREFSVFHGMDDFVQRRISELEDIKSGQWRFDLEVRQA